MPKKRSNDMRQDVTEAIAKRCAAGAAKSLYIADFLDEYKYSAYFSYLASFERHQTLRIVYLSREGKVLYSVTVRGEKIRTFLSSPQIIGSVAAAHRAQIVVASLFDPSPRDVKRLAAKVQELYLALRPVMLYDFVFFDGHSATCFIRPLQKLLP